MAAVGAFARVNGIDRVVINSPRPRLGLVAAGKAYLDLRQALSELGISEAIAAEIGIRVYKVALTWPLEPEGARRFAEGLSDILVVEEKRGLIEPQLMRLLYNVDVQRGGRPLSVRSTRAERRFLPSTGELTPTMVARAIVCRLKRHPATYRRSRRAWHGCNSFERSSAAQP